MQVNESIFKAYDVRGVYPTDFNEGVAYAIGRGAMDTVLAGAKGRPVLLGHDARTSSKGLARECIRGLRNGGADVIFIGPATTPLFYFSVITSQAAGGIMITASHNPANYNGCKIVRNNAVAVGLDSGLSGLRDWIAQGSMPPPAEESGYSENNFIGAYIDRITHGVVTKKFRIIADGGNGMAGLVLPKVAGRLGLDIRGLYLEPYGTFPNHEANPLKLETLKDLQRALTEH